MYHTRFTGVDVRTERTAEPTLFLELVGPLCLRDATGTELTPKSRKAQGLLALIGAAPGLRRSRTWLQDKLWSDRGPEQGAASLRQCLTGIRVALGAHVDCLKTEGGWVAFDPGRVRVRTEPSERERGCDGEFLEGLDIRDPEFEHWLRDQRMHYSERSRLGVGCAGDEFAVERLPGRPIAIARPARSTVGLVARHAPGEDAEARLTSDYVLDLVASFLLDHAAVDVIDLRTHGEQDFGPLHVERPDWLLRAASSVRKDRARVSLVLSEAGSDRVVWAEAATLDVSDFYQPEQRGVGIFVDRVTSYIAGQAARPGVSIQERARLSANSPAANRRPS